MTDIDYTSVQFVYYFHVDPTHNHQHNTIYEKHFVRIQKLKRFAQNLTDQIEVNPKRRCPLTYLQRSLCSTSFAPALQSRTSSISR
ncbi:hypothetical protein VTO42DRAFT_5195 [Malbranchea cinnamomea]